MDILYYIGHGSHHNNQELRYSLRALEQHCQDIGRVWVVGNRPHFLNNQVQYLWVEDKGAWWQNAFIKTLAAIEAGISEDFLLMNDDFYMLKDFSAQKYPYYHKGDIADKVCNKYQEVIVNTKHVLQNLGKPFKHYGVHCPMRINGAKYRQLEAFYANSYVTGPVSARCLYGNLFCRGTRVKDNKGAELKGCTTGCFSSVDAVNSEVLAQLQAMFPQPSRWENGDV